MGLSRTVFQINGMEISVENLNFSTLGVFNAPAKGSLFPLVLCSARRKLKKNTQRWGYKAYKV